MWREKIQNSMTWVVNGTVYSIYYWFIVKKNFPWRKTWIIFGKNVATWFPQTTFMFVEIIDRTYILDNLVLIEFGFHTFILENMMIPFFLFFLWAGNLDCILTTTSLLNEGDFCIIILWGRESLLVWRIYF